MKQIHQKVLICTNLEYFIMNYSGLHLQQCHYLKNYHLKILVILFNSHCKIPSTFQNF
jgi:hypothetical protein